MKDIEFISYDGKYPNLCSGTLVLKIDGQDNSFKHCLHSGGSVYHDGNWNWTVESGDWNFDPEYSTIDEGKTKLEDFNFTKNEIKWINMVVNENVEHGCCGGCI